MKLTFSLRNTHFLIRLLLFWVLLFAFYRLVFIVFHYSLIPANSRSEVWLSFWYGLRLDIATACFAITIPYILWVFQQFVKKSFLSKAAIVVSIACIVIVSILSIANIKIYGDWGTLLSARALNYLLYPAEVLAFVSIAQLVFLLFIAALFIVGAIFLFRKMAINFSYVIEKPLLKIVQILIIPVFLVLGYRGGLQLSPINESSVCYSNAQINNQIATNSIWYLAHSIVEANDHKNPFVFMDDASAKAIVTNLFSSDSLSGKTILKNKQPNIIIIVLESWTADIIKALGGEENVTPHFDELRKEGLLFTQMYGSGFRTEQGLVAVLSGFPAQPNNSIITTPSKVGQLPTLTKDLVTQGYHSSFYYGGEVEFANMKSYLLNSGFEKMVDKNNFEKNQLNSKWGAHDEFVFNKQLNELKNEQQPFFSMLLTLSTHEPFEVNMQTPFNGTEESEKFKKAAYYTDNCLFNYFTEAKKQAWYANTLFVLVADHGHHLPKNRNMDYAESRRITALLTGGALLDELKGTTCDKIVNQHDLPATILAMLQQPHTAYGWSRNVFAPTMKEFAYYSNENVLGWISTKQNIAFPFATYVPEIQAKTDSVLNDSVLTDAKAYLQIMYEHYLNY